MTSSNSNETTGMDSIKNTVDGSIDDFEKNYVNTSPFGTPMTIADREKEILTKFKPEFVTEELKNLENRKQQILWMLHAEEMARVRVKKFTEKWTEKLWSELNKADVQHKTVIKIPSWGYDFDKNETIVIESLQKRLYENITARGFKYEPKKETEQFNDFMDGACVRENIFVTVTNPKFY